MSSKKSVNKIVTLNLISTVILQGITMLTAPVFSRLLGTGNYGVVSIYNTWVSVATMVVGMQTSSVIVAAQNHFPEREQDEYNSSILWLTTIVFAVVSVGMTALATPMASLFKIPVMAFVCILPQAFGSACVSYLNTEMTLKFRADVNCKLSISVAVFTAALSLLLVLLIPAEINYMGRVLGMSIVYFLFGIGALCYFTRRGKTIYKAEYWKFCIPLSIPMIFHGLSGVVLTQSDKLMLNHFLSDSVVGIYSLAFAFSNIMIVIWNALNSSWVPFYYEYMRENDRKQLQEHSWNYMELFTVITLGFMLLAPDVFRIYADRTYWDGISLLPIFVAGNYFVFLYSFPVNFEFYHKKTKVIASGTVLAAIGNIILNWYFIQQFDIMGAVCATAIAHGLQFLFHYIIARWILKKEKFSYSSRFLFGPATVVVLTAFVILIIGTRFIIIRWCVGAMLGVVELLRIYKRRGIF